MCDNIFMKTPSNLKNHFKYEIPKSMYEYDGRHSFDIYIEIIIQLAKEGYITIEYSKQLIEYIQNDALYVSIFTPEFGNVYLEKIRTKFIRCIVLTTGKTWNYYRNIYFNWTYNIRPYLRSTGFEYSLQTNDIPNLQIDPKFVKHNKINRTEVVISFILLKKYLIFYQHMK